MRPLSLLLAFLTACGGETTPAPEAKKTDKPSCELDLDKLGGTAWVHMNNAVPGKETPNPQARLRFMVNGTQIEADYTANSVGDVYHYTCTKSGGLLTCLEKEPQIEAWCKAQAAVNNGACDADKLAQVLGMPVEQIKPVADKVNAELKKLKPKERETQQKVDNSPNNKLRSKFLVAVDKAKCTLTLQDKYQTMYNGQLQEFEQALGTATFAKVEDKYIWTTCKDADNAWAPDPKGYHQMVQTPGTIKFEAGLGNGVKPESSCTYTADVYKDWVKASEGLEAVVESGKVRWRTELPFTEKGIHAVYFDRKKTCNGAVTPIGLTCAAIKIE